MSDATKLQTLQHQAIDTINKIVEARGVTLEERCAALQLVREHLSTRVRQTMPDCPECSNTGLVLGGKGEPCGRCPR